MYLKEGCRLLNDKYHVLNVLGEGGFSLTYRGAWKTEIQGSLGKVPTLVPVCIKEYFFKDYCRRNQDTGFVETINEAGKEIFEKNKEKIVKEARILSEINHPNVVNVLEVFKQNNTVYIVMEFVSGYSLKQETEQKGVISEEKLKTIIYKIGQALDHIHSKNILHLDIKPSNILMDKNNNPKLIDFGISKRYDLADDQQTSTTLQAASKGYASIEQYDSEGIQSFSPRPDIYSLGATMYFLLTKQVPTESILRSTKGLQNPREINPNISEKIEAVILKAMALHADDRYETIMEMLLDLDYDPETDKINANEIPSNLAEKTEIIRKIKEQPYDVDLEDATVLHPDREGKIEKKKDHFWFFLLFIGIGIALVIFVLVRKNDPGEAKNPINQPVNANEWIFKNYFNAGVEHFNKRNLSQARESFNDALTIKDDAEAQAYINRIDSINSVLVLSDEPIIENTEKGNEEQEEQRKEPEQKPEIDVAQENYNKLFNSALTTYNQQDYATALLLFEEAIEYKNTAEARRYIDRSKEAIEKIETEKKLDQYEKFPNFGNFVVARKKSDGMFGVIDAKGNVKIEFKYLSTELLEDGNRLFQRSDHTYDLYSPSGDLLDSGISDF